MAALATVADLEARLARSLTAEETTRADALLDGASARVRSYTGQTFTQATTTDRLRVRSGAVRLPQRPVTDVTAVADMNTNDVTHTWHNGDVVYVTADVPDSWAWEPRRNGLSWVDVTYEHGYAAVPDDVIEVVCQMVLRAFGQPADGAGFTSESVGTYSYSVGAAAAAGAVGMLADERAALDVYRRVGSTARVGW